MENLNSCPLCHKPDFTIFIEGRDYFLSREPFTIVSCNSCGFKFLNPRPDSVEIQHYYHSEEYISHDAGKTNFLNSIYRLVRNRMLRKKYHLIREVAKGDKLLDIGCGTGEFIHFCSRRGFKVAGVEPGEKPRAFARSAYHLEVNQESFLEQFDSPEYDVITLWHVLEHVHLLGERMQRISKLLKPEGNLIMAVPNSNSWDAKHYGEYWAAYDLPRHLYHFSPDTLEILAENYGFKIEKIIPMKLDAFYISLLSEKYSTGSKNYPTAFLNGIRSNLSASRNRNNYSSLIILLSKKSAK